MSWDEQSRQRRSRVLLPLQTASSIPNLRKKTIDIIFFLKLPLFTSFYIKPKRVIVFFLTSSCYLFLYEGQSRTRRCFARGQEWKEGMGDWGRGNLGGNVFNLGAVFFAWVKMFLIWGRFFCLSENISGPGSIFDNQPWEQDTNQGQVWPLGQLDWGSGSDGAWQEGALAA